MSGESNKGVALLTVLVSILIMSLLTIEFQYSVAIERKLAYSDLNQLQAHYLAKSGARFALLRVALFARADKLASATPAAGGAQSLLAIAKPYLPYIWNLPIPAFPPTEAGIKKLDKADKDAAEKALEETKISIGQFAQTITNESAKINLNYLVVPQNLLNTLPSNLSLTSGSTPTSLVEYVARQLYNAITAIIKRSDNPNEEFGNIRPEEVVLDIMDWVNPSSANFSGGNRDSFYEQQKPPYKTKRGPFFTVEELKMVKSVEENLYNKLKPLVTVYSSEGKINLNDATNDVLRAIYPDFTDDDLNKIQEEKSKNKAWASEAAFVTFVTGTLGRSGFAQLYPDDKKYPFTVNSYSFIIEATGTIPKNKLTIQRTIKVAAALTSGGGQAGTACPGTNPDKATCEKNPACFFRLDFQTCLYRPQNSQQCDFLIGQWNAQNGGSCVIPLTAGTGTQTQTITAPTGTGPSKPDTLKILYWMET
jgi:type II secretory pathway component PulK